MATSLLEGVRVVDLAGEPAAAAGRVLADLGADVVLVEPPGGMALRALPHHWAAWAAGKRSVVVDGPDDARLRELLAGADIVIEYGASIADLGRSIQRNVKQSIERMTGLEVVEVNVAVDDVHLPTPEGEEKPPPRVS